MVNLILFCRWGKREWFLVFSVVLICCLAMLEGVLAGGRNGSGSAIENSFVGQSRGRPRKERRLTYIAASFVVVVPLFLR